MQIEGNVDYSFQDSEAYGQQSVQKVQDIVWGMCEASKDNTC